MPGRPARAPALRALIDSMIFDAIADEPGMLERLDRLTRAHRVELLTTPVSVAQIAAIPDPARRRRLQRVRVLVVAPAGARSPALRALRATGLAEDDAAIAAAAEGQGVPLVTEDRELQAAARAPGAGVEVWTWAADLRPRILREDGAMNPVPILLDCDPGHDDVVAILLAAGSPAIELRAITTVGGNGDLEQVTRNALRICTLAGIEVPIAAGCAGPLLGATLQTAPEVHGASGLDGVELPEPDRTVDDAHAVDLLAAHLRAADAPLTVVATGPLTNVALLLRRHPELAPAIREIVLMGGTIGEGNRRPLAEFNIFVDPEAAHIVFSSGLPVTMCGLNVTHQALATDDVLARLEALGTPVARTVVGLLRFYAGRYRELFGFAAAPVHDPVAVARLIAPEVVGCVAANVVIELAGEYTRGATVVDRHGVTGRPVNAQVATTLDAPAFWTLVHDAVATLGQP